MDIVTTEGELRVLENLRRKSEAADLMFKRLVGYMRDALEISMEDGHEKKEVLPSWL